MTFGELQVGDKFLLPSDRTVYVKLITQKYQPKETHNAKLGSNCSYMDNAVRYWSVAETAIVERVE